MNADGYVTIGTKLDTKDLEKEYNKVVSRLRNLDAEAKRLEEREMKANIDLKPYEEERREIEKNAKFKIVTAEDEQTKKWALMEQNRQMIELNEKYAKQLLNMDNINKKITQTERAQVSLNAKAKELGKELQKSTRLDGIKNSINDVQNKMSKIVKTAIKWGLAIFGIRSAYLFVRSAMSTLTQYDTQMKANVEYIRWALAMSLKPVIEFIIKLAYKLLGILRYIIKLLFNYDIFAKAGAKEFEKAQKSVQKTSNSIKKSKKDLKDIQKQLASFDEMNILGDNVKQAGDGDTGTPSGSDILTPNLEIPEIKDIKINIDWDKVFDTILEKIEWIRDKIQEVVKKFFDDLGNKWIKNGEKMGGILGDWSIRIGEFFKNLGDIIQLYVDGIADIFEGLVRIIKGIFGGDIKEVINGGFEIVKGLFKIGLSSIASTFNILTTIWKGIFDTWKNVIGSLFSGVVTIFSNKINEIKAKFIALKNAMPTIFKGIGTTIGKVFQNAFKLIFNKLMADLENRLNIPIKAINSLIGSINKLLPKSKKMGKLKTIKLPRLAKGGIVNLPSAGVPVGNAIAGERGAEGVIPLTDAQQMALLGEAIGKYITINANITNNMNGRVISRELQRIQNDDNFAYNR